MNLSRVRDAFVGGYSCTVWNLWEPSVELSEPLKARGKLPIKVWKQLALRHRPKHGNHADLQPESLVILPVHPLAPAKSLGTWVFSYAFGCEF